MRKVVRSGLTAFEYDRELQPRPKPGRWTADLEELLAGNVTRAPREQLALARIFEELSMRGYDAVRRYARRWSKAHGQSTAAAYIPPSFAPGEACQFDCSHEVVVLNGTTDSEGRPRSALPPPYAARTGISA